MIRYRRRGVEKGEPVGEHVRTTLFVSVAVGFLKLLEGDPLLGEVVVILLAGGNALLGFCLEGGSVITEGGGGEPGLFLGHELKRQLSFLCFGHVFHSRCVYRCLLKPFYHSKVSVSTLNFSSSKEKSGVLYLIKKRSANTMIKIYGMPTCPYCDYVHEQIRTSL